MSPLRILGNLKSYIYYPIKAKKIRHLYRCMDSRLPRDLIKFLIISAPRSGSNLFCGKLNSHTQIVCFHELFHKKGIFYGPNNHGLYDFGNISQRDRSPVDFLKRVYSHQHGFEAVGFKMFYGQNNLVLFSLIRNIHIKKIFLHRPAALHVYTSQEIAKQSNEYQVVKNTQQVPKVARRIVVNPETFKNFVDVRDKIRARMIRHLGHQRYLTLNYTDIVEQSEAFQSVLEFIGVNQSDRLTSIHKKQNPSTLQERISNYDEVYTSLTGTKYEKYLKDELQDTVQ